MNHRNVGALGAALAVTLAAAGTKAQGLSNQGEGLVDGEFLKPAASFQRICVSSKACSFGRRKRRSPENLTPSKK